MDNFSFVLPGQLAGMNYPMGKDFDFLRNQGISAIVTLTERSLCTETLEHYQMEYLHLPIEDFQPPRIDQVEKFVHFVDSMIEQKKALAVHCAAGMGRTGTMLSCYLVRTGLEPGEAIKKIRALRPGSIEVKEQEDVIYEYGAGKI